MSTLAKLVALSHTYTWRKRHIIATGFPCLSQRRRLAPRWHTEQADSTAITIPERHKLAARSKSKAARVDGGARGGRGAEEARISGKLQNAIGVPRPGAMDIADWRRQVTVDQDQQGRDQDQQGVQGRGHAIHAMPHARLEPLEPFEKSKRQRWEGSGPNNGIGIRTIIRTPPRAEI